MNVTGMGSTPRDAEAWNAAADEVRKGRPQHWARLSAAERRRVVALVVLDDRTRADQFMRDRCGPLSEVA